MDNPNFDAVARAVAAGASRRHVLRLLAIGTVIGWLPRRARAVPARQECDEGLTFCEDSGVCTDLRDDANNCGECGNVCASGVCDGGVCVEVGCAEGLADCTGSGVCTSLIDDPNNCGECGNVCESGVCDGGTCTEVGCAAGFTYCEAFGACYDLASDPNHCGACDVTCASSDAVDMACVDGVCVAAGCVSPLIDCAGACVDVSVDPNNCGTCGAICASGVCEAGVCAPPTCETGLTYCEEEDACYDLATDATHCGTCGTVCESGICTSGVCAQPTTTPATPAATSTTTPETPAVPTPTTTPVTDEQVTAQDALPTGSGSPRRGRAPRTGGTASESSSAGTAPAADKPARARQTTATEAPESVLAWPFDPEAGQWTIVHGYRPDDEGTNTVATPPAGGRDFARFGLAFALCRPEGVDEVDGTCELGPVSGRSDAGADELGWDTKATEGANVLSPVDGTVAWTEEANATCLSIGIDIKGHPGYRLALFNVEGHPERGQAVKRGKRIGKVAKEGCEEGDALSMVLYRPQAGATDDPEEGRDGVPFADEWAIDGCEYPDDRRTANQYRGELVPCKPEDQVSGGPDIGGARPRLRTVSRSVVRVSREGADTP